MSNAKNATESVSESLKDENACLTYAAKQKKLNELLARIAAMDQKTALLIVDPMCGAAKKIQNGENPDLAPFETITSDVIRGMKTRDIAEKIKLEQNILNQLLDSSTDLKAQIEAKNREMNRLLDEFSQTPKKSLSERFMSHVSPYLRKIRNCLAIRQDPDFSAKVSDFNQALESIAQQDGRVGNVVLDQMIDNMTKVVNGGVPSYTRFDSVVAEVIEQQRQERINRQIEEVKNDLSGLYKTMDDLQRTIQQKRDTLQDLMVMAKENEKQKRKTQTFLSFVTPKITKFVKNLCMSREDKVIEKFTEGPLAGFDNDTHYLSEIMRAPMDKMAEVLERNAFILECMYVDRPATLGEDFTTLHAILKEAASALPEGRVDSILNQAHANALSLKNPGMARSPERWWQIATQAVQMQETPFSFLRYISPENRTEKLYMKAFSRHDAIKEIRHPTQKLCDMAVMANWGGFANIPEEFRRGADNVDDYKMAIINDNPNDLTMQDVVFAEQSM